MNVLFQRLEIFEYLDASREKTTWLEAVYVSPPSESNLAEPTSTVILARPGRGRTAWAQIGLKQYLNNSKDFLVFWSPEQEPASSQEKDTSIIPFLDLARNLYKATLQHLQRTQQWEELSHWHQAYLIWLAHQLEAPPPWEEEASLWMDLQQRPLDPKLVKTFERQPWEQRGRPLAFILDQLGFQRIWIIWDIPGREENNDKLRQYTRAIFYTLSFFELPYIYKFLLPASWQDILQGSPAIQRHRVTVRKLAWSFKGLLNLTQQRLSWLCNKPISLEALCEDPQWLQTYLMRAGGDSPREWLAQLRPLVRTWVEQKLKPLSLPECRHILAQFPPHLSLDDQHRVVRVGGREIPYGQLPEHGLELLRLLLARFPGVVSTSDAYQHTYGLQQENPYLHRSMQRTLDTLVHRLRQIIEPDPKYPVLLVRKRRQGLQLHQMSGYEEPFMP